MREGLSRLSWLAAVVVLFCLPLFVGLGSTDLQNDEAIYSYAVQSILETGDWLSPRSSPNPSTVFLEKPPLKFWIVAAPIALGVLPNDEFGLRFVDAVVGSAAFIYVFLLGRRLAGPLCGFVAVLVLAAHTPLIFDHGVRSNNMDAALMLAYCGGLYHYLRATAETRPRQRRHIAAVAAACLLGFLTKFVAVVFMPLVAGIVALAFPAHRAALRRDWHVWTVAVLGAAALAAPWFIYQYHEHGRALWEIMLGDHVVTRFTAYTDPAHLAPWHFYFSTLYEKAAQSGSVPWIALGLLVLIARLVRQPRPESVLVLVWAFVPMTLISFGTSKLYHYLYPYLPPFALAAGYGIAWIVQTMTPAFHRAANLARVPGRPPLTPLRSAFLVLMLLALAVALATAAWGPLRMSVAGIELRNSSVLRPLLVAAVFAVLAGSFRVALAGALVAATVALLPTPVRGYVANLRQTRVEHQPLKRLGACLQRVDDDRRIAGGTVHGVYAPLDAYLHQYFFYLRHAGGWDSRSLVDDEVMRRGLFVAGDERPILLDGERYADFLARISPAVRVPVAIPIGKAVLLLPGPYGQCRAAWRESAPEGAQ